MRRDRRGAILALLSGAALGVLWLAVRRGVPGASGLAARLAPARRDPVEAKGYGYKEVNIS